MSDPTHDSVGNKIPTVAEWFGEPKPNAAAARISELEAALRSIAANTCCDKCREAALVAKQALES